MPNSNEQTRLHFLSGSFEEKIRILKKTFQQSGDFEYRELMVNETKSALFFIKTRIDEGKLNDFIIGNLLGLLESRIIQNLLAHLKQAT